MTGLYKSCDLPNLPQAPLANHKGKTVWYAHTHMYGGFPKFLCLETAILRDIVLARIFRGLPAVHFQLLKSESCDFFQYKCSTQNALLQLRLERRNFSAQLGVATVQYEVGTLTSAALRNYLPLLRSHAGFRGSFAEPSRKTPTIQIAKPPTKSTHTHTHTPIGDSELRLTAIVATFQLRRALTGPGLGNGRQEPTFVGASWLCFLSLWLLFPSRLVWFCWIWQEKPSKRETLRRVLKGQPSTCGPSCYLKMISGGGELPKATHTPLPRSDWKRWDNFKSLNR